MSEFDERLLVVEMQSKQNQKELEKLKHLHYSLHNDFKALASTLTTIKNWLIGAVAFAIVQQIGVIEFMKKVIF
jgi:hypothetical protein